MEPLGSCSRTSGHCPNLIWMGFETPVGVITRISRGVREASAAAVSLTTNRLSSLGRVGSAREMPPRVDSMPMLGPADAGGGAIVADKPGSPIKKKLVTAPRFSPEKTTSSDVPR